MRDLTIIIPSYNEARFLDAVIGAIVRETSEKDELILVDDCSTDRTPEVAARWAPWVRYFRMDRRMGVAFCRRFAANVASGDALCFVDAHLFPSPGSFQQLLESALDREAVIAPSWSWFDAHEVKLKARGVTWEESLSRAKTLRGKRNHGSSLVFAGHKSWFYLAFTRRHKAPLERRTACNAGGVTMSRRTYLRMDGWLRLPGWWSSNDIGLSIKAYLMDIPILNEPRAHFWHAEKSVRSRACPGRDQILNRFYVARQLFSDELYACFWKPRLSSTFGSGDDFRPQLESEAARAERELLRSKFRVPEQKFMERFVVERRGQDA